MEFTDWFDPFHRERVILKNAGGHSNVKMRFRFVSDNEHIEGYEKGWYVDNIRIIDPSTKASWPRRFYIEPFQRFNRIHTSPEYVEEGGGWTSIPTHNCTALFGKNSGQARGNSFTNTNTGKSTFTPYFPASGTYNIHVSWGLMGNAENASFIVNHNLGSTRVLLDQNGFNGNEDQWHKLGTFYFNSGSDKDKGSIVIDESTVTGPMQTSYDGMISFDLIRFELIEEDVPRMPPMNSWMIY